MIDRFFLAIAVSQNVTNMQLEFCLCASFGLVGWEGNLGELYNVTVITKIKDLDRCSMEFSVMLGVQVC